jgi:uncharacterized glyoxalase superfamily protein PhnB
MVDGFPFWAAEESPDHLNFSPATLGGSSIGLILTVDDPDAVFDLAVAHGATAAVADQTYGGRVGGLVDPFGHHWEIGKPLRWIVGGGLMSVGDCWKWVALCCRVRFRNDSCSFA